MSMRPKLILFPSRDRAILRAVARRLRTTESEVIRCALRWYALGGPWRDPDEPLLRPLVGLADELEVIPTRDQYGRSL